MNHKLQTTVRDDRDALDSQPLADDYDAALDRFIGEIVMDFATREKIWELCELEADSERRDLERMKRRGRHRAARRVLIRGQTHETLVST